MDVVYELRARFGDRADDIVASEYDASNFQLEQAGETILIPKDNARTFAEYLLAWFETAVKPCAS